MHPSSVGQTTNFLSQRARSSLRNTSNALWDVLNDLWHPQLNPSGFVTLGVADNPLLQDQLLRRLKSNYNPLERHLCLGDSITGSDRLKCAVADFLTTHFQPSRPLKSSHIVATNGVASAIEHCSWAMCDPGEGMLVGRPYFRGFSRDICLRPGVNLVPVSFGDVDPVTIPAVSKYEEAIISSYERGCSIRAIMLCNPHNPLGRCYSRSFLTELMKLCQKYHIHIISDEIYALSVWRQGMDGTTTMEDFTSVLSIAKEGLIDPKLVHALWGVSKDFGANGLRLGFLISQNNPDLLESVRGVAQYSSISGLADYTATAFLEDKEFVDAYVKHNREKLAASFNHVTAFLDLHEIPYARGSNAGFFVWCDLLTAYMRLQHPDLAADSKLERSKALTERLAQCKVHLGVGDDFGGEEPGWYRITFSQHRDLLDEGLRRILLALRS
ncbi:hypothetical protein AbraIFM66951_008167 [Aspergillus brasiliensis]|nr:hypothetical protein AbraIFM66951_008167 [Aspergillus brasiliensis]